MMVWMEHVSPFKYNYFGWYMFKFRECNSINAILPTRLCDRDNQILVVLVLCFPRFLVVFFSAYQVSTHWRFPASHQHPNSPTQSIESTFRGLYPQERLSDKCHWKRCQSKSWKGDGKESWCTALLLNKTTHRIHVWYIHLHLVDFYGKCR